MDYTVHGFLQARILEWVAFPFSRGSSQPRDRTRSLALQVDSLPAEPPGKPKNTGVGSLSLLQQIFLTQESNRDLLHCRRILYPNPKSQLNFLLLLKNLSYSQKHQDNSLPCDCSFPHCPAHSSHSNLLLFPGSVSSLSRV